jgi:hypothetical protein
MNFLSSIIVFEALHSEISLHLKRQVNIVCFLLFFIIQMYVSHISSYLSLEYGFLQLYSPYTYFLFHL